ncbi:hypothetical protein [Pseudomonas sp.]|uniref:hypothetical protein n=1 Tax=Pseudomonas sp. TaxID=306 RepID=UPI003C739618
MLTVDNAPPGSPGGAFLCPDGFLGALEQVNKGCNKLVASQAKVDASQQKQQTKAQNNDAVKALGGLFK